MNMAINEHLPEEILRAIFAYVGIRDRMMFVERVCSKWRNVLNYSDVHHLDVFALHDEICLLDFDCPFRRASNRPNENPLPEIWLLKFISKVLPKFGCSLKSLSFQIQKFSNIQLVAIRLEIVEFVLRVCPNLTDLNFFRCQLSQQAVECLPLFSHLTTLKIKNQVDFDVVWPELAAVKNLECETGFGQNFLSSGQKLSSLHICKPILPDGHSSNLPLANIVEFYPTIIDLDVKNCNLSEVDLSLITEFRQLQCLSISLSDASGDSGFYKIVGKCHMLCDLTLFDLRSAESTLSFDCLVNRPGTQLKRLLVNSPKSLTPQQLKAIKKLASLRTLIIRTNKLPPIEESSEKSECVELEELSLSCSNQTEKYHQYKVFLNSCSTLNKIGYLPRGWSLHTVDGIEPETLNEYLAHSNRSCQMIKLLLYAKNSEDLNELSKYQFPELTGLIVFGSCQMSDDTANNIQMNCPRVAYILTENSIEISSWAVVSLLTCKQLTEIHVKYSNLEVDGNICYAIGNSSSLKHVGFRGLLMAYKIKLYKNDWDKVMQGRAELFRQGRTCQRMFVDCWYNKIWPRKLAVAFRALWLSCQAAKIIQDE